MTCFRIGYKPSPKTNMFLKQEFLILNQISETVIAQEAAGESLLM